MTQIVLIGGSRLLRSGLKLMLEEVGAEICGEYTATEDVNGGTAGRGPRPIYLLKHSPGASGIRQEITNLRHMDPEARIAVMVACLAANDLVDVFTVGGDGLILEDIGTSALYESLKLIELGEKVFPSQLATLLSGGGRSTETVLRRTNGNPLTSREIEIVRCLTAGMSNKEIANRLDLAVATVKVHVKSLLKKLALANRTQAAIWALDAGLADPPCVMVPPAHIKGTAASEIRKQQAS